MKNRTFKFRAFDVEYESWIDPSLLEVFNNDGVLRCLYDHDSLYTIIQQFTGLLDKNGKEIYEGDICRFQLGHIRSEVGTIVYKNYGFCFNGSTIHGTYLGILESGFPKGFEIIGNIFENPELLEK